MKTSSFTSNFPAVVKPQEYNQRRRSSRRSMAPEAVYVPSPSTSTPSKLDTPMASSPMSLESQDSPSSSLSPMAVHLVQDQPSTADSSVIVEAHRISFANSVSSSITNRNHHFQQQAILLTGVVVLSGVSFVCSILSTAALVSLLTMLSSSGLLLVAASRHAVRMVQSALQGDGLGSLLLPASLYQTLTEQSLHEYLTQESESTEMRHILLYFLPGVSKEQLDRYAARLAPAQQEQLLRPGLGQFLGPQWMRMLVGDRGMAQLSMTHPTIQLGTMQQPRQLTITSYNSETDDSMHHLSADDFVGGMSEQQALVTGRALVPTGAWTRSTASSSSDQDDDDSEDDKEEKEEESKRVTAVLSDALYESYMNSIYIPMHDAITSTVSSVALPLSRTLVHTGLGVSLASTVVGVLGYGVTASPYLSNRLLTSSSALTRSYARSDTTRNSSLWLTIMGSGASAGLLLWAANRRLQAIGSPNEKEENDNDDESEQPSSDKSTHHL
jgi:hypothetical protein